VQELDLAKMVRIRMGLLQLDLAKLASQDLWKIMAVAMPAKREITTRKRYMFHDIFVY
jgi:hypothetical protein